MDLSKGGRLGPEASAAELQQGSDLLVGRSIGGHQVGERLELPRIETQGARRRVPLLLRATTFRNECVELALPLFGDSLGLLVECVARTQRFLIPLPWGGVPLNGRQMCGGPAGVMKRDQRQVAPIGGAVGAFGWQLDVQGSAVPQRLAKRRGGLGSDSGDPADTSVEG